MANALAYIVAEICNLLLLAGTAYLVGWQGWSPWWFLVAIGCLTTVKSKKKEPTP